MMHLETGAKRSGLVTADVVSACENVPLWQQRAAELRILHEVPDCMSDDEFTLSRSMSFDKHEVNL